MLTQTLYCTLHDVQGTVYFSVLYLAPAASLPTFGFLNNKKKKVNLTDAVPAKVLLKEHLCYFLALQSFVLSISELHNRSLYSD
jgi:hypothetical protein